MNQVIRKLAKMNEFDDWVNKSKTNPLAYRLNGSFIIDQGDGTFSAFTSIHDNGTMRFKECELPIRPESLSHYRLRLVRRFLKIQELREYSGYDLNKKRKRIIRKLKNLIEMKDNILKSVEQQLPIPIAISSSVSLIQRCIQAFLKWLRKIGLTIRGFLIKPSIVSPYNKIWSIRRS